MSEKKSYRLYVRLEESLARAIERVAKREHCTVSTMTRTLLWKSIESRRYSAGKIDENYAARIRLQECRDLGAI